MDAEGARALARRIAGGPSPEHVPGRAESGSGGDGSEPARVIFGLRIYRTVEQRSLVDGRRAVVRRRVCKALVAGRWVSSVVREDVERLDPEPR